MAQGLTPSPTEPWALDHGRAQRPRPRASTPRRRCRPRKTELNSEAGTVTAHPATNLELELSPLPGDEATFQQTPTAHGPVWAQLGRAGRPDPAPPGPTD
eukprot:7098743-Alexandrium_andersonii.AAC.1